MPFKNYNSKPVTGKISHVFTMWVRDEGQNHESQLDKKSKEIWTEALQNVSGPHKNDQFCPQNPLY